VGEGDLKAMQEVDQVIFQRRHVKTGYKFGIKIPRTIQEALELDKQDQWQ